MNIMIPEADDIYFPKTREYFQEVLSSYYNGNYRSAVVMLYSVAICDILFKLQELKDMYNDKAASDILEQIENKRKNNSGSKSSWEKDLIDTVRKSTELLDLEAYTNLNHLYDHRNFSAHPAINDNFELVSPTKETVIACIKNTLKDILVKPPVFIKNVVEMLTEDIKGKIDLYDNARNELETFLNNRYYSRMSSKMKISTFKALWKFCFKISDNTECANNRRINRLTLQVLTKDIVLQKEIEAEMKSNGEYYTVAYDNEDCINNLIEFLSVFPQLYKCLNSNTQLIIERQVEKNDFCKILCWFKFSSLQEHISYLASCSDLSVKKQCVNTLRSVSLLIDYYKENGELHSLIDFIIDFYGNSQAYDTANAGFDVLVEPVLPNVDYAQAVRLIEVSNENTQIYQRWNSYRDNTEIVRQLKNRLGSDFDYSKYKHFGFDKSVLAESASEDEEKELDFSGINVSDITI